MDGSGAIDRGEMVSALRNMYRVHGGDAAPDGDAIEAQASPPLLSLTQPLSSSPSPGPAHLTVA